MRATCSHGMVVGVHVRGGVLMSGEGGTGVGIPAPGSLLRVSSSVPPPFDGYLIQSQFRVPMEREENC